MTPDVRGCRTSSRAPRWFPRDGRGEQVLESLPYRRAVRRENKDGTFRWYVEYDVPCPRGGQPQMIRVPTVTSAADDKSGFNRSENVRQVAYHAEQYSQIRSRVSDAESINRAINDALPLKRARSFGYRGVLANALSHALIMNSVSRARYQARTAATEHRQAA